MMITRSLLSVCALSALAACALSTPPKRNEVLAEALPKVATPSAWKAAPKATPTAADWLQSLNDPALTAIVNEALANNLDLRQAAERVSVAQQNVVVVGAQMQPQVGVALGGRATQTEGGSSGADSSLLYAGLGWEIDIWGKLRAQRAAAQAGFDASSAEYAFARQSLAATVARTWYLAVETRQLIKLSEQSVDIYSKLLTLVSQRRVAGKDSDLDVVDTQAKLESAQSALISTQQAYGDVRRGLEALLGRYPSAEIEVAANFSPLGLPPKTDVPAALLERRADVLAAERAVLAAFRNTEAAQLALRPNFSFSLVGGRLGDTLMSLLNLNPWLASAAIGVSMPIYEGGALQAQVKIATASQAQAVAAYGSVVLKAFREVETSLANEQLLAQRQPLDESALRNRAASVRIASVQYRAGRRDLLWVSNLQTSELAAEADLIKLRSTQRLNRIALLLALGGSFDANATTQQFETKTASADVLQSQNQKDK